MRDDQTTTIDRSPSGVTPGHEAGAGLVLLYAPDMRTHRHVTSIGNVLLIGRDPGPEHLCIPQGGVSRVHARIVHTERGYVLTDMGSRNGTLASGRRVGEVLLEQGHELRFGDAIYKFVARGAADHAGFVFDGERVPMPLPGVVGTYALARVGAELSVIARSQETVLLLGETGTGKEAFAQAVHKSSGREGPFVALNAAALAPTLMESELFGFRRGAFSGADRDNPGHIRSAHGGTLFLDEVGELPLEAQSKLLRVLETREVMPLGTSTTTPVDVRFVCATNRSLSQEVSERRFREDLYARMMTHAVRIPPLRDRKEDIYPLACHFLSEKGLRPSSLTPEFMALLIHHAYPYNVRELRGAVHRAALLKEGPVLALTHLPDSFRDTMANYASGLSAQEPAGAPEPKPPKPSAAELVALLVEHRGNVSHVAKAVSRSRALIHKWMDEYGLDPATFR